MVHPRNPASIIVIVAFIALAGLASCESGSPTAPGDEAGKSPIALSTRSLTFSPTENEHQVTMTNMTSGLLNWSVEGTTASWLSVSPTAGTLAPGAFQNLLIRIDRSGLDAGKHSAVVRISGAGRVSVLAVSVEQAAPAQASLEPGELVLESDDVSGVLEVVNPGGQALDWTLGGPTWVSFDRSNGRVPPGGRQQVVVTPDRSDLAEGTHKGTLRLESNGGDDTTSLMVQVTESSGSPAQLRVSPTSLDFGETSTRLTLRVINEGGEPLDWSATSAAGWTTLSTASGRILPGASQDVVVTVARSNLSAGQHQTTIEVDSNGGSATVPVSLYVPSESPPDGDPQLSDIDPTGTRDVSDEMNAYIASVPDGSTITFPAGATYRLENTLIIEGRSNLTIEGNGALIFAETDGSGIQPYEGRGHLWPRGRQHIEVAGSSNIVIRDLVVRGGHPDAGSHHGAYVAALEGQHGFAIRGSSNVTLERVRVTDVYGDFVYLGGGPVDGERVWSRDVTVRDSHFERNGRQGVAVVSAADVLFENNHIGGVGRSMVDIEPLGPGYGAHNITFRNNTFTDCRHAWVSSGGGGGNVFGILFESNHLIGRAMNVKVQDSGGEGRRGSHAFINNTSDTRVEAPKPAFIFKNIDGVTVIGNTHGAPARSRYRFVGEDEPADVLVYTCNSTDIEIHDNDYRGFTQGEHLEGEVCYVDSDD